jgi:hypothetical protein
MRLTSAVQTSTSKAVCEECGYKNLAGTLFCEDCGLPVDMQVKNAYKKAVLTDVRNQEVESHTQAERVTAEEPPPTIVFNDTKPGTFKFEAESRLMFEIEGTRETVMVTLPQTKPIVLGRNDGDSSFVPEVDLVPFEALRNGVSRRHAALKLKRKRLDLVDLKSSNGTFLNGVRLDPGEPQQLRDGDKLQLGQMNITVRFASA